MQKDFLISSERHVLKEADGLSSSEIFAAEMLRKHRYMYYLDQAVKQETGHEDFSSMEMAILNYALFRIIHISHFYIEPYDPGENAPLGLNEFDYHKLYIPPLGEAVPAKKDQILIPQLRINYRAFKPFLQNEKYRQILNGYHFIASFNHDFAENICAPKIFNGYKKEFNVQPCEHFVSSLHSKAMKLMLAAEPELRKQIIITIAETIHLLNEFRHSGAENSTEIADIWLEKLISSSLYFIPLYDMANESVTTSYGETSINQALIAYGCSYSMTEEIGKSFMQRHIISTNQRSSSGILLHEKWIDDFTTARLYFNPYAQVALERFSLIAGIVDDNYDKTLHGFSAYCANMLFRNAPGYDLSHFWVHDYDKVAMLEAEDTLCILEQDISDKLENILLSADLDEIEKGGKGQLLKTSTCLAATYHKVVREMPLYDSIYFLTGNPLPRIRSLEQAIEKQQNLVVEPDIKFITGSNRFKIACENEAKNEAGLVR